MPYQQLLQQHSRVPHTGLLQLLQQSVQRVQSSGYPGAEVWLHYVTTLHMRSVVMQQCLSVELTQTSSCPELGTAGNHVHGCCCAWVYP
jgi:hypothetical protein